MMKAKLINYIENIPEELKNETFSLPCILVTHTFTGSMQGAAETYQLIEIPEISGLYPEEAFVEGYKKGAGIND